MASIDDRIKELEGQLAELRTLKEHGDMSRELQEAFAAVRSRGGNHYVIFGIQTETGEVIADWRVPFALVGSEMEDMGRKLGMKTHPSPGRPRPGRP